MDLLRSKSASPRHPRQNTRENIEAIQDLASRCFTEPQPDEVGHRSWLWCHIWNELRIPVPTKLFAHTEQRLLTVPRMSFSVTAESLRRRGMLDASGELMKWRPS